MNALSPWALSASSKLAEVNTALYEYIAGSFEFRVYHTTDSIWIVTTLPNSGRASFRAAFSPAGNLEVKKATRDIQGVVLELGCSIGKQYVEIIIDKENEIPVLHYLTILKPNKNLLIPFWPRDIMMDGKNVYPEDSTGQIHVSQEGTRTGLLYFTQTKPESASILYLQNLTALGEYCQQTRTSSSKEVTGRKWVLPSLHAKTKP